jgi:formyltetrahydrofolate hydrolase
MSKFKGKWLAFFSQTGSEICELSQKLGRYPNCIITDNTLNTPVIDERIYSYGQLISSKYRGLTNDQKIKYYRDYAPHYDVITLHGWLNIVPAEICEQYKIYNGHPGLITLYPELKGRDPQLKAWNSLCTYMYIGSVVHNVTATVDAGRVITEDKVFAAVVETLDETYSALKQTSLNSWVDFFKYKHYNKVC